MPFNFDGIDMKCGGGKTIRIVKARRRSYGPEVCNEGPIQGSIEAANKGKHAGDSLVLSTAASPPAPAPGIITDLKNNKARPVPMIIKDVVAPLKPYKKTSFATWSHYHEKHKLAYLMLMSCVHAEKSPPAPPVPGTISQAEEECVPYKDLGESTETMVENLKLEEMNISN